MAKTLSPEEKDQRSQELRLTFPEMPDGFAVLFASLIEASTLEDDLTVSEWADAYRYIGAESGSRYPGKWRTSRVPYTKQPMDCLHPDHPARSIVLKWSAQTGKSEIGVNWFGFIVDRAPAPILTILPTDGEAKKYNRVKLQPTIDASPQIAKRVTPENARDQSASTTAFKRFAGGFDQITTATSSKGLQMISVRYLIFDEASGYPHDTDGRGSPLDQGRARAKSYAETAKEFMPSTPGTAGACVVSEHFDKGDRRRCYLPCPFCGTYQALTYERMQAPVPETDNKATFSCIDEECGRSIGQDHLEWMEERLRWVPMRVEEGEAPIPAAIAPADIDAFAVLPCMGRVARWQPSWALWSAYSQMERWTDIWQRGEDAKGDPLKEKTFTQQDLGEPWSPKTDTPDWHRLVAVLKSWPRGIVPYPVAALFGFFDVQGNRLEWGLWGFGPGFQAWLVDRGVLKGGMSDHVLSFHSDEAWKAVDALIARRWPTAAGGEMPVVQWGMDTGAYSQALYDRIAKRPLLLSTKGANRPGAPPFKLSRADMRDANGNPIAGRQVDLAHIGNFELKMSVYEGLRHLVVGPDPSGQYPQGTVHLPDWVGEDELQQLTAETLVDPRFQTAANGKLKVVRPGDQRYWDCPPHKRNEGLDIAVGARGLAWGAGAGTLTQEDWLRRAEEAHRAPEAQPPAAEPEAPPEPATDDDFEAMFARLAAVNAGA